MFWKKLKGEEFKGVKLSRIEDRNGRLGIGGRFRRSILNVCMMLIQKTRFSQ